jgi:hypothetical protein
MQNIVNEARIARGARLGKIATFAGLGLLGGGLVVSLFMAESPLLWLSFVFLLLGLLVSSVGSMNMNRWVREPRADQALAQALKGFDDRYRLYSYYLPAPHVLLSPSGLFVFTAMGQDGKIRYEGDRFQRDFSVLRLLRFLAEEGMGKPFAEGDSQVAALREYLAENDLDEDVELQNVVVFYNPRAELTVSSPPRPVASPKGLKKAIRKTGSQDLPDDLYQQLGELFDQNVDW